MTSKGSREEKRLQRLEKLRQYGVDLPDIPGLPVEVIPLHVYAIKMTATLFGKNGPFRTKVLYLRDDGDAQIRSQDGTLVTNILQRVEDATNQHPTSEERTIENEILHKHQEGMQGWLSAIHRCVKDQTTRQAREASSETVSHSTYSVPVAALQHLWSVGMDHKRFSIRRATQHLAGKLLEKSSDARSWWLQTDDHDEFSSRRQGSVLDWMDHVLQSQTEENASAQKLWQLEAFDLLKHLERKAYGAFYPTLTSAIQRFEQKCPVNILSLEEVENEEGESTRIKSMANFRFFEDTAMEHWEEVDRKLEKLIRKAKKCFDVLVPRIDDNIPTASIVRTEDEDEEDIDWEDGFDDFDAENGKALNVGVHHADAVERTLELMKSTGGMHEGQLEISLFSHDEKNEYSNNNDANVESRPEHAESKQTLDRVTTILTKNYMPRLSAWAQALAVADNLKVKKRTGKCVNDDAPNTDPLVQMTDCEQIQRREILQRCLEAKQQVAHILQSAKRLGVDLDDTQPAEVREVPPPNSTFPSRALQNGRLPARLAVGKRFLRKGSRSTPLQIKFAKR